jgi:heavy metal sensor kinase
MRAWFRTADRGLLSFLQSIRFRLTLWFVLILGLVLTAFSTVIYTTQSRDLQSDAVGHIQEKFLRIQTFFRSPAWQLSELSPGSVPGNDAPLQKGDLLILLDPNGAILQHWGETISAPEALMKDLSSAGSQREGISVYEQAVQTGDSNGVAMKSDYLFLVTPVVRDGVRLGDLVVGSPSDLISQQHRLAVTLTVGSLAMLVLAFLGGLWLADRAMRPVSAITRAARNISEHDLDRRLNLRGHDELVDLAETFDAMIGRLQAAFDRQRRFVADASHELRTPLTIINLEVGRALSSQRTSTDYRRALEVVETEGARMTRLVNDLMTLARMDSGQAILQFADVELGDLASLAVERLTPLAERRRVSLARGELAQLHVRGDRQYLLQMISNLVENGIKYSGAGQCVRIETARLDGLATLRVSDTGPGIPPEHLPTVFDRFYRVDAARSQNASDADSASGSGLGLSIVSWIVRAHGGTINVASKLDQGTTFEVTLPLAE